MPTNILDIVRQDLHFETRNNADWRDGWLIGGAPTAVDVSDATNVGNGTIGTVTVEPGVLPTVLRVDISEIEGGVTFFALRGLNGTVYARGVVGAPIQAEGLTFTVAQGGTPFAVGDGFTITVLNQALNITGIAFRLALKQTADSAGTTKTTVALRIATTLADAPNAFSSVLVNDGVTGVLGLSVPAAHMAAIKPGIYNYDLVAKAEGYTMTAAVGTVDHTRGIS